MNIKHKHCHHHKKTNYTKLEHKSSCSNKTGDCIVCKPIIKHTCEKCEIHNKNKEIALLPLNIPNPPYSAQVIRRPDDNKYFQNYTYSYNVQVDKPTLTYDDYMTQQFQKNMTNQEWKYYNKLNQKYFYYGNNYSLINNQPSQFTVQSRLHYPMMTTNSVIHSNNTFGPNNSGVQNYTNSPEYTGILAK
jgi:hypothetical protein